MTTAFFNVTSRKSYSLEIADFYNLINSEETKVTKSAFCQQRMKIKDLFFACLNEILVDHYAGFPYHFLPVQSTGDHSEAM